MVVSQILLVQRSRGAQQKLMLQEITFGEKTTLECAHLDVRKALVVIVLKQIFGIIFHKITLT